MTFRTFRIDVAICTRDRLFLLPKAVDAVLAAAGDRAGFRLLIIDNGSVDGTAKYLERLSARDGRVVTIAVPEIGIYNARIAAIQTSDADILVFIDDDVVPDLDFLDQFEVAFQDPVVGVVGGEIRAIHMGALPPWFSRKMLDMVPILPVHGAEEERVYPCYPPGACLGLRRDPCQNYYLTPERRRIGLGHGGRQQVPGEDTDLCDIYARAGFRIIRVASVKVGHHVIPSKITRKWLNHRFYQEGRLRVLMARLRGKSGLCRETFPMLAALPAVAVLAFVLAAAMDRRAIIMRAYFAKCCGAWSELFKGERQTRFSYPPMPLE